MRSSTKIRTGYLPQSLVSNTNVGNFRQVTIKDEGQNTKLRIQNLHLSRCWANSSAWPGGPRTEDDLVHGVVLRGAKVSLEAPQLSPNWSFKKSSGVSTVSEIGFVSVPRLQDDLYGRTRYRHPVPSPYKQEKQWKAYPYSIFKNEYVKFISSFCKKKKKKKINK